MLFIDLVSKVLAHNGGALWFHPQPQEVSPTSIPSKSLLGRFPVGTNKKTETPLKI